MKVVLPTYDGEKSAACICSVTVTSACILTETATSEPGSHEAATDAHYHYRLTWPIIFRVFRMEMPTRSLAKISDKGYCAKPEENKYPRDYLHKEAMKMFNWRDDEIWEVERADAEICGQFQGTAIDLFVCRHQPLSEPNGVLPVSQTILTRTIFCCTWVKGKLWIMSGPDPPNIIRSSCEKTALI